MNDRREEALDLVRRTEQDVDPEEEVARIEEDLAYEEKGSFLELFQGHFRLAATFVIGLGFLIQITGINAIVYYSPTIITKVGVEDPFTAIAINGVIQLCGAAAVGVAFLVVDRWGRRPTLLTGVSTMAAANAILILAFALGPSPVLAFIGILLFIVGFNFGYGSLVWIYASESFPARLRTQGGSAMLTSDLFANFLVGVIFLNALGALGGSVTFAIFLILALLSLVFIYRLAPETKGRQLESIRRYWYNGFGLRKGVQQLGDGHYADAFVAPERQQLFISRHDGRRAGGYGTLEYSVVRLVVEYGELNLRFHDGCYLPDTPIRIVQLLLRETELWPGQFSTQFRQDCRRDNQLQDAPRRKL
jgi:MFS family permease